MAPVNLVTSALYAVRLWLVVFSSSAVAGAVLGSRLSGETEGKLVAGTVTQAMFLVLSLAAASLVGVKGMVTYHVDRRVLVDSLYSFTAFLALSTLLNYANRHLVRDGEIAPVPKGEFESHRALALFTLAVLAPLGEETLFRGLVEGYLIASHEPIYVAILLPALLFTAIHIQPLKGRVVLLVEVFLVGILLDYLRVIAPSLVPVVISHSALNVGALIFAYFEPRHY